MRIFLIKYILTLKLKTVYDMVNTAYVCTDLIETKKKKVMKIWKLYINKVLNVNIKICVQMLFCFKIKNVLLLQG